MPDTDVDMAFRAHMEGEGTGDKAAAEVDKVASATNKQKQSQEAATLATIAQVQVWSQYVEMANMAYEVTSRVATSLNYLGLLTDEQMKQFMKFQAVVGIVTSAMKVYLLVQKLMTLEIWKNVAAKIAQIGVETLGLGLLAVGAALAVGAGIYASAKAGYGAQHGAYVPPQSRTDSVPMMVGRTDQAEWVLRDQDIDIIASRVGGGGKSGRAGSASEPIYVVMLGDPTTTALERERARGR